MLLVAVVVIVDMKVLDGVVIGVVDGEVGLLVFVVVSDVDVVGEVDVVTVVD